MTRMFLKMIASETTRTTELLEMRRPALFVFAAPELHGLCIVLDLSIAGVELELPVHLPGNIGELKHRNRHIANSNRSVQFLSLLNTGNKVGEVHVCHGVAASEVRRRGRLTGLELACLVSFEVVDLVTVAIDEHGPG